MMMITPIPSRPNVISWGRMFGATWRSRMREPDVPDSRAARMNVCSRSCSVAAREMRANAGTLKNDSAKIVWSLLGPRLSAIASASTSTGNAIRTSTRRLTIRSTGPPR
jgi:hypothetical protein